MPASLVVLLAVSTAPAWAQTPDGGAPDARPTAPAVDGGASAAAPGSPTAAPTAPVTGALQVVKVSFRGNRKVEDDALRVNLRTLPGASITQELVREDVRALWRMGFFEDIQVEATNVPGGVAIVFVLKEKPSIHKIFVSGHDEIGLTKVNEVLDLKKEQILDLAKVKKNMEKIREVYLQRGFYMADVTYELKRVNQSEVDITFRVHENSKVEVRRVNFVGNKAASDSDLRSVMFTQEADLLSFVTSAGTYREDVFQRDVAMLQAYYLDRGYVHAKISEPKFELSADKRSLFITIPIDEGVPYKLGKIDFQGDLIEDKAKILNRLRVKPGDTFNRSKLGQDIQELTEEYKDRGFAYVNIIPQTPIDEKTRIVDVVFEIQKGSEVTFERINIRGNTKTRDKVIRREMRVIEGERYSASGLELSKSRVTALGFFERVDFSEKRGQSDDKIEVNVEIAEKQTGAFQIGAGFSSAENFIFQAQISQNNLLGRGQSLSLQAMLSSLRQLFQLSFIEPYFLDTRWTFGFDLFNQFQYYPSFQRKTRGGSLTWGYMLVDNLHLYLRYTLEEVNISTSGRTAFLSGGQRTPFPAGTLANLLRPGLKSSVRLSISHDTRDNRLFTNRGWFNEASAELAEPILLSQTRFTRYDATSRYFYPLWGPFVLRLKGQFGLVTSRDPEGVPIFERYFVGGIYDVRGFRPYTLGPRIRAPDAQTPDSLLNDRTIGGNMQVVTKAEIEFPIIEKVGIRAVLFADAGNAYNLEDQYCSLRPSNPHSSVDPCVKLTKFGDINSLRASWGFGFRWFSPIGPLRFEWGLPFKPLANEEPMIFEFTIGNDL
ncbi:MAG TPA: outer membrane protein assembly factor BamA [Polyangia bacterium]